MPSDAASGGAPLDDTGAPVPVPGRVRRVVSLVPSLTETVVATAPDLLVGATDWCTHPPGLDVARVRGTKNPDLDRIADLRPDVVLG
ncbi:MAG: cobalamin-binding protein, partial [Actinomadura rubrobrunea]|nr:cobalamin-binding protein [Actinomadura rubrobrunea]